MSLSTDALLFSIGLVLFGVWRSLEVPDADGFVLLGLVVAVFALFRSFASAANSGSDSAPRTGGAGGAGGASESTDVAGEEP